MTEQERLQQMKTVTHMCYEQGYRQTICHQGDFQNEHLIVSQLVHDLAMMISCTTLNSVMSGKLIFLLIVSFPQHQQEELSHNCNLPVCQEPGPGPHHQPCVLCFPLFFQDGSPPTDMTEYFTTEEKLLTHQERTKRYCIPTHVYIYIFPPCSC